MEKVQFSENNFTNCSKDVDVSANIIDTDHSKDTLQNTYSNFLSDNYTQQETLESMKERYEISVSKLKLKEKISTQRTF